MIRKQAFGEVLNVRSLIMDTHYKKLFWAYMYIYNNMYLLLRYICTYIDNFWNRHKLTILSRPRPGVRMYMETHGRSQVKDGRPTVVLYLSLIPRPKLGENRTFYHGYCKDQRIFYVIPRYVTMEYGKWYKSFLLTQCNEVRAFEVQNRVIYRPVGRNFQRGVRSIRQGVWGPLKAPRSPWVFGTKSCNLAISRHFIQTFGKPCFLKIFIKFYTN